MTFDYWINSDIYYFGYRIQSGQIDSNFVEFGLELTRVGSNRISGFIGQVDYGCYQVSWFSDCYQIGYRFGSIKCYRMQRCGSPQVASGSGLRLTGQIKFRVNIGSIWVCFEIPISQIYLVRILVSFRWFIGLGNFLSSQPTAGVSLSLCSGLNCGLV